MGSFERHVEEEMAFEKAIAEAVPAAVNAEAAKKLEMRSNTKSAKTKNIKVTHEGLITGELITLVITALQPVLVKAMTAAITTAVATASKQIMLDLQHDLQPVECVRKEMETLRTQEQSQNLISYNSTATGTTSECTGLPRLHVKLKMKTQTASSLKWQRTWALIFLNMT